MYTLQNGNVVKITDSADRRDKYISEGYRLVADEEKPDVPHEEKTAKKKA